MKLILETNLGPLETELTSTAHGYTLKSVEASFCVTVPRISAELLTRKLARDARRNGERAVRVSRIVAV